MHIRRCGTCTLLLLIIGSISADIEKVVLLDHVRVLEHVLVWCRPTLFNTRWHALLLKRLIWDFLVGQQLLLLRLVFLGIEFNLISFKELIFRIVQAFLVYVLLFFIIIVVILFFIDFGAAGVDMLVVLVLFILVFCIVSVKSTLEELLLVNSHLRSRWQVLLSTSWRLFLLRASICVLPLLLSG